MKKTVYVGYDSPYPQAFNVAVRSVVRSLGYVTPARTVRGLHLKSLVEAGIYTRPTNADGQGRLTDVISDNAPMSTEFALSRFLVPYLAACNGNKSGAALFMDCDMMIRGNILEVFNKVKEDPSKAVWVVKHDVRQAPEVEAIPGTTEVKMDGQVQTWYDRKLWSSFMLFNQAHPAVQALTPERVNNVMGLYLHQFRWCEDDEIGELPASWNWLVGMQEEPEGGAQNVHWTTGGPWLQAFEDAPYHREWNQLLTNVVHDPVDVDRTEILA